MATADVVTKPEFQRVKIADIQVGSRYRKALGDLESFASSIRKDGLLHPIVVDENLKLIAGYRRLMACRDVLEWDTIPAHIVPLRDLVWGEYVENAFRQDYLPSEMAAISKALNIGQRQEARQRQAKAGPQSGKGRKRSGMGKLPQAVRGRAKDKVAKALGTSRRTLDKIEKVTKAAEEDPELQPLVEEMDRTRNVDAAYKKVTERQPRRRGRTPNKDRRMMKLWGILVDIEKLREAWPEVETLVAGFNAGDLDRFVKRLAEETSYLERALDAARARKSALAPHEAEEQEVDSAPEDQVLEDQVPVNQDDFINLP